MKEVYLKLLYLGVRAINYNGDTDMACNFLGNQWFVEDLGLQVQKKCSLTFETIFGCFVLIKFSTKMPDKNPSFKCYSQSTSNYQSWFHKDQIAGFYQQFGNLTFLTLKVTPVFISLCHLNNVFTFD